MTSEQLKSKEVFDRENQEAIDTGVYMTRRVATERLITYAECARDGAMPTAAVEYLKKLHWIDDVNKKYFTKGGE